MCREDTDTSATNHGFNITQKSPKVHTIKPLLENIYTEILGEVERLLAMPLFYM